MKNRNIFKAAEKKELGDNWLICFGKDAEGSNWYVTTDHVHASELYQFSDGAKADAVLVARLLNWYNADRDFAELMMAQDPDSYIDARADTDLLPFTSPAPGTLTREEVEAGG